MRGSNANTEIPQSFEQNTIKCSSINLAGAPKISKEDWIKEQDADKDISPVAELVRQGKHLQYTCKEGDPSEMRVLLKYKQICSLGTTCYIIKFKNHDSVINQFVFPKT